MFDFNHDYSHGCPCLGCTERHTACHAECERYRKWKEDLKAAKQEERRYLDSIYTISDRRKRQIWKKQRWSSKNAKHNRSNTDR